MKISDLISRKIEHLPNGQVFTYADMMNDPNQKEAIIKTLNRMTLAGKIMKLAKGKFYKPENSTFGNLPPDQREIVKDLLEKDGKIIGYLTGYSIYNQLALTSQISNSIQIGKNDIRATFKRRQFTISFIKQKNQITKESIPLLQILDVIRYQKRIPDTTPMLIGIRIFDLVKALTSNERKILVKLANNYQPFVQAFVGMILTELNDSEYVRPLKESLNPITKYQLPTAKSFASARSWNIV